MNAESTIQEIVNKGHYVALISSGVPEILMKDLAKRLNADCGYGIDIKTDNDIYTGEIKGALSYSEGKTQVIEELLKNTNPYMGRCNCCGR